MKTTSFTVELQFEHTPLKFVLEIVKIKIVQLGVQQRQHKNSTR